MKRLGILLLALSLSGCTAVGATESTAPEKVTVQVVVDNRSPVSVEAVALDGQVYLPASVVFAAMNREASVEESAVRVYNRPAVKSLRVQEDPKEFHQAIQDALSLLQEKAPKQYAVIVQNVELIVPSGTKYAASFPETNTISVDVSISPTWTATTLAHEAEHLRIAHEQPELLSQIAENERQAYRVSLEVAKLIGAPQWEIDEEQKRLSNPMRDR